jgi:hypothetical protein
VALGWIVAAQAKRVNIGLEGQMIAGGIASAAVALSLDGVPMVFPGQELGISATYGYTHYELNFGKYVPHFKRFNSMQPIWDNADFGLDQLYPVYAGIGAARAFSPALRSSNRWFLDGDGSNNKIHAEAKYEAANALPAFSDVVLAFASLDRGNDRQDNFRIPSALAPLLGIRDGRSYNVKNIAAYLGADSSRRDQWLWNGSAGYSGSHLKNTGFLVVLPKVPTMDWSANPSDPAWNQRPFEAQYLKLYDVTPPPAPAAPAGPNIYAYVVGDSATFTWSPASDPDGGVSGYRLQVGTSEGGAELLDATTTATSRTLDLGGLAFGTVVHARVCQLNNAGIEGPFSSPGSAIDGFQTMIMYCRRLPRGMNISGTWQPSSGGTSRPVMTTINRPGTSRSSVTRISTVSSSYQCTSSKTTSAGPPPVAAIR